MIIIKLQGGLGNQLFQYGFGMLLKQYYHKEVGYDVSFFSENHGYATRRFLLDAFAVDSQVLTKEQIQKVRYPHGIFSRIVYLFSKLHIVKGNKKYHIGYEDTFLPELTLRDSAYVEGYFVSYKYIDPVKEELLSLLRLRGERSQEYKDMEQDIISHESIAVHIRRGDYVTADKNTKVLDRRYYEKALWYMKKNAVDRQYYVFSDDIEWVKQNMGDLFSTVTYVSGGSFSEAEELILMSKCHHTIIANSTFSWWGAYLNTYKKAVIICPKDWKNPYLSKEIDICPPSWVRI